MTLNNITIDNISTNYKSIFEINYRNIELYNVDISNINLYDDVNNALLFSINAGNNDINMIFENVNLLNVTSNGNIISIKGYKMNIQFNNVNVNNTISNGAFMYSVADNVIIKKKIYLYYIFNYFLFKIY